MLPHPKLVLLRTLARRIAFLADSREPEGFRGLQEQCLELVAAIDPDRVNRDGDDYVHGGFDALSAVLFAMEEHSLSASTLQLLQKSERARILLAVQTHSGLNQKELAERLDIQASNLAVYLRELIEDGLLEPSPASGKRGRSYGLTPWGQKAWAVVVKAPKQYRVPSAELPRSAPVDTQTPSRLEPVAAPVLSSGSSEGGLWSVLLEKDRKRAA